MIGHSNGGQSKAADEISSDNGREGSSEPAIERVGYKKPPVASQFKKGLSGNPAGRPRGRRSFRTELREVLDAKVVVTDAGRKSKVSTTHAMLLRLRQQALNGDVRAIDRLLLLAAAHLPPDPPQDAEAQSREDQEIIDAFQRSSIAGGHSNDQ